MTRQELELKAKEFDSKLKRHPMSSEELQKVLCDFVEALNQHDVNGTLPIEEVALHAADDWFDLAKFRSDVKADLKSYYEGYRDAMQFCQGND